MIVLKSKLTLLADEARIAARVVSENETFAPFDLSIGVPACFAGWLDLSGNPLLPMLLPLAAVLGERLRIEGSVSPQLLGNARVAGDLMQRWWGVAPVSVEAEGSAIERPAGAATGLFFTRGVDSWYSALLSKAGGIPESITHLIYAPDFDRQYSAGTRRRALELTREAGRSLGLPLIPTSCNARELLDRFINWERSHGGVLAGIGLAMGGGISTLITSSTMDLEHQVPWGSHHALDPLWSTERTSVRMVGAEASRTRKVAFIAASDLALSSLKVCWREDIDTNCGRCEKCLRTQCALAIVAALDRADVFQQPLTPEAIAALGRLQGADPMSAQEALWYELCENFTDEPRLADIRDAAFGRLPDRHRLAIRKPSNFERPVTIEAPPGAAVSLLPHAATEVLPVSVRTRSGATPENRDGTRVEITWTVPPPGSVPLPLRPPSSIALEVLHACRDEGLRPNPWCMIGGSSPDSARLLDRLTESWGQGIACLTRIGLESGDHGIPSGEAALIQDHSELRVWWGEGGYLDPFLVLESLRHGCLPLQCVSRSGYESLAATLPRGLVQFLLPIPEEGAVPPISRQEKSARLDEGLSVLLSGNLERDLARILPSI